jgi:hypothetical protein
MGHPAQFVDISVAIVDQIEIEWARALVEALALEVFER